MTNGEANLQSPKIIRFNKENLEVSVEHRIRRELYCVVGKLGRPPRESLRVMHELSKSRHEEKVLHQLVDDAESWERIKLVKRFQGTRMPFPKIDAVCQKSGEILVVREYIVGKSLGWHLRMKKEITAYQAIWLYNQLVGQICFLHKKTGIVHGDLAPANMILSPSGKSVSLIDFGSSFTFSESGDPAPGDGFREIYQAPENLAGSPASRLSEQFSAASIFYEMLTRKAPYHVVEKRDFGGGQTELTPASARPASEQRLPPALWSLIDQHLAKALSLDASKRFQTLDEWRESADDLRTKSKYPELLQLELNNRTILQWLLAWLKR